MLLWTIVESFFFSFSWLFLFLSYHHLYGHSYVASIVLFHWFIHIVNAIATSTHWQYQANVGGNQSPTYMYVGVTLIPIPYQPVLSRLMTSQFSRFCCRWCCFYCWFVNCLLYSSSFSTIFYHKCELPVTNDTFSSYSGIISFDSLLSIHLKMNIIRHPYDQWFPKCDPKEF